VALVSKGEFTPPSTFQINGKYLDESYQRCRKDMDSSILNGQMARKYGLVFVGDGASNVNRDPVLNVLALMGRTCVFIECRLVKGRIKDGPFIASLFIEAIKELEDPTIVVACSQDGATKASWKLIEKELPHVTCFHCGPHVVNLMFKDIGALPGIKALLQCVDNLRVFIRNHHATKAVYDGLAKTSLLKPGRTRFAYQIIGIRNMLKNHQALVDTLSADEVEDFILSNGSTKDADEIRLREKLAQLKSIFLDPEGKVWKRMRILCALLAPIEQLLRFVELDLPVMSKLHDAWTRLIAYLEDARSAHLTRSPSSRDANTMAEIIRITRKRFVYGYSPLHLVSYLLDPEFRMQEYNNDQFTTFVKYLRERVLFNTPRELVTPQCGILVAEFLVYRNQEASFTSTLSQESRGGPQSGGYQYFSSA
jgi:hypothetical protein